MQTIIKIINRFSETLGWLTGWLTLLMVLMMTSVVVLRYAFDLGFIALQESVLYLHGAIFLLGSGYTLKHDEHVRVDVFYRKMSKQKQGLVDLFGHLFLALPVVGFIFFMSLDYVLGSWKITESSLEAGGLPFVYIQKTFILIFAVVLGLQALAQAVQSFLNFTQDRDVFQCSNDTLDALSAQSSKNTNNKEQN